MGMALRPDYKAQSLPRILKLARDISSPRASRPSHWAAVDASPAPFYGLPDCETIRKIHCGRDKSCPHDLNIAKMLTPFTSQLIADTGISTGDEGKGRVILEIIHELRETTGRDDAVAAVMKVNGGSNSGHTVAGLKLNLLPGGVADDEVPYLPIGAGVVADPRKFLWESAYAELHGHVAVKRLAIDERCLMSDLTHRLLDLAWEDYRVHVQRGDPRGSTGRGITPAYLDEVGQFQIYYADFLGSKSYFEE